MNAPSPLTATEFSTLMAPLAITSPLAVAVSGGADSMALLLLAHRWATQQNLPLTALTIDHGIRPEAAHEAQQVHAWCKALGIEHHLLSRATSNEQRATQETARDLRYELLTVWCKENTVEHLLTAHHRDDQTETFFFRLARGSGLDGLACMQPRTMLESVALFRPFLPIAKSRLIATLRAANQPWIEDPSNTNPRYTRVIIRNKLAACADFETISARAFAITQTLTKFRNLLENNTARKLTSCISFTPEGATLDIFAFAALEPEYGLRVLARLIQSIGGRTHKPRTEKLDRLYRAIAQNRLLHSRNLSGCTFSPTSTEDKIFVSREHPPAP